MGWEDRDYHRDEERSGFLPRLGSHSVVTWLLAINFAVFVIDAIISGGFRTEHWYTPTALGEFTLAQGVKQLQVWRLITFQFLHHGIFHLFGNMLGIFFFGPMMEQWWGSKRFLAYYLISGASGACLFAILALVVPGLLWKNPSVADAASLTGASGGVFAILVGCAVLYPNQRIMLIFPPIPMTMRTMALVFLGIAAFAMLAGTANAGGEAAHLGGAALGFLLVKFPASLAWVERIRLPRKSAAASWEKKMRKQRDTEAKEQAEVDRILDKVRDHGLHSLSKTEKRILQRATDRQRRAG